MRFRPARTCHVSVGTRVSTGAHNFPREFLGAQIGRLANARNSTRLTESQRTQERYPSPPALCLYIHSRAPQCGTAPTSRLSQLAPRERNRGQTALKRRLINVEVVTKRSSGYRPIELGEHLSGFDSL